MGRRRHRDAGFTYLGLLFAIAVLGIALSTVGVVWSAQLRRDREAELLYVGDQIRTAIGRYRNNGGQYPQSLADLLQDDRVPTVRRFLRRVSPDPMTGAADWQLIYAPEGGILGVASVARGKPLKVAGFSASDAAFEGAECYCDWKFIYSPRNVRHRRLPPPATQP